MQKYNLRTSTHEIYIEKFDTFLRLVETVLVPYLKTGHDSIQMLFFKSICIYGSFHRYGRYI